MAQDIYSILDQARKEDGEGNVPSALVKYRLFLKYEAGDAQAWADYAGCLLAAGRQEDSVKACNAALGISPGMEPALVNKAAALVGLGRFSDAKDIYGSLLASRPGRVDIAMEMQKCMYTMGDVEAMEPSLLEILAAEPGRLDALSLLAAVYAARKDWGKFEARSLEYLAAKFTGQDLLCETAKLLVRMGRFGECLRVAKNRPSDRKDSGAAGPLWGGEPFPGRTLLLHWEQGFGDSIMMLRYGSLAKELGGTVVLCIQPALLELARTCPGFDAVVAGVPDGLKYDLQLPLMSLPFVLVGTDTAPAPARVPYLRVPDNVKNRGPIQERLRVAASRRKIGLVWAGSGNYGHDHIRSVPPGELWPLAECRGAAWFCLQREAPGFAPFEGATPMGDLMETFADTALLLDSMDEVLTVDTSTAHLAGALGKPTHLMLPFRGEWRWLEERTDSPWYPTLRIHRRACGGSWTDLLRRTPLAEATYTNPCGARGNDGSK